MHLKQKIHTIPTHWRPHPDEFAAINIALQFGQKMFSDTLRVAFYDAGIKTPDGKPVEDWMSRGFFPVGIWGGPCDEHRAGARSRKRDECAATLMAKILGVFEDTKLTPILRYVLACDSGKANISSNDDLSLAVNTLHWMYPTDPHKVMNWFFQAMDAKYGDGVEPNNFSLGYIRSRMLSLGYKSANEWYELAKDVLLAREIHLEMVTANEFSKNSEILSTAGAYAKKVKVAVVKSDDELICRYAFSKDGGRCDVVIQQKNTRNVQIFSNKHRGVYLYNVAPVIRKLAMDVHERYSRNLSHEYLSREGSEIFGAEEWCFMHGHLLLNGSNTAPHTKPTKIPFEKIVSGVCEGLAIKKAKKHDAKIAA